MGRRRHLLIFLRLQVFWSRHRRLEESVFCSFSLQIYIDLELSLCLIQFISESLIHVLLLRQVVLKLLLAGWNDSVAGFVIFELLLWKPSLSLCFKLRDLCRLPLAQLLHWSQLSDVFLRLCSFLSGCSQKLVSCLITLPQLLESVSPSVCSLHHHIPYQLVLNAVHRVALDFFDLPSRDHSIP